MARKTESLQRRREIADSEPLPLALRFEEYNECEFGKLIERRKTDE